MIKLGDFYPGKEYDLYVKVRCLKNYLLLYPFNQ